MANGATELVEELDAGRSPFLPRGFWMRNAQTASSIKERSATEAWRKIEQA